MAIKLDPDGHVRFTSENHPVTGPLPELRHKLVGLWAHDGTILRAYFEAPQIPLEHREIGYYRYEPALTNLRARYFYFWVPGYAGMILKPAVLTRLAQKWDAPLPETLEDLCSQFPVLYTQDLSRLSI